MSDKHTKDEARRLALISSDAGLVAMAKGAITTNDQQTFVCISKDISEIGAEIRDLDCHAVILDIDATKVEIGRASCRERV